MSDGVCGAASVCRVAAMACRGAETPSTAMVEGEPLRTPKVTPNHTEKTSEEMPCLNSIFASLPLYPFLHNDEPEIFKWRSAGVSYSV